MSGFRSVCIGFGRFVAWVVACVVLGLLGAMLVGCGGGAGAMPFGPVQAGDTATVMPVDCADSSVCAQ